MQSILTTLVYLHNEIEELSNNKHMKGHKGNSEFCFPETLKTLISEYFPKNQSLGVLLYLPPCLMPAG